MAWRGEWQYLTDNFDADDQTGWSTGNWEDLRNINYFLGNFRRASASEAILNHYEGVARFWRAYFYMNKVKTFGAVPWYDKEIDSGDHAALYKPRDSREYVMSKVLEDLDFSLPELYYQCQTGSQLGAYHPQCGAGFQGALLPLRRHFPQVPRDRPLDGGAPGLRTKPRNTCVPASRRAKR